MHVQRMGVDRWALSMEVSPEMWLDGELRIHVHASLQKWRSAMYAKHASELVVGNAEPVNSVQL
eukprot:8154550-Prorocentrum_lima.AAC.1